MKLEMATIVGKESRDDEGNGKKERVIFESLLLELSSRLTRTDVIFSCQYCSEVSAASAFQPCACIKRLGLK